MQDPVADLLTRIRNGQMARKKAVSMPSSNLKQSLLKVLQEEGYAISCPHEQCYGYKCE